MSEDDTYTPMRIGARNPFVWAEHKLNEKIEWKNKDMKWEDKQEKLEAAFDGRPYSELFDPIYGSPLFVQTGDVRPCTTVSNPTWAINPAGSNYTKTSRAYNDLVQGDLPDCYFIAALSSIAFVAVTIPNPNLIPDKPNQPYTYTFYNSPTQAASVTVTNLLPLDANSNYHYSKSYTLGEIWPAMYEKAFAKWKGSVTDDKPDYSIICQGDPLLALMNLTGWKFTTFIPGPGADPATSTATRYSTQDFTTGTQIFDKIKNYACKFLGPVYRVAKFPMVAYTYPTAPPGITYSNATIVANHSYSVLGVHTLGADTYIVMRNPWGQKGAGYGSGDPVFPGALASGAWWNVVDLADVNDAIFALKTDVFRNYFKGFGWVSP